MRTHLGFVRSGMAPRLVSDAIAALTAVKSELGLPDEGGETNITLPSSWEAIASRNAAAPVGSVQVTPVEVSRWPPSKTPSRVPMIASITWSAAEFAEFSAAPTANSSCSTVTPSAFCPSIATRRTVPGAIDTPSTMST
ncbi:hypothetical protein PICSAR35_04578 [Mycobacterium avium subsp. paratuberculosis]|nr:hypothetical protein PICSAR35_04578 [Mycobacterium avium subsp. paratuberculosis]